MHFNLLISEDPAAMRCKVFEIIIIGNFSDTFFATFSIVKRMAAIAIVSVFLINGAGFYVYYIIQLRQIRHEMREALKHIPDNELEVIKLTKEQFSKASVEQHEIRVNGKMYDIACIKSAGEMLLVYCLHDEKEDSLLAFLNEIVSRPLKDKTPHQILQFISLWYVIPETGFNIGAEENNVTFDIQYCFSLQTFSTSPVSPPPWI